jgi:hypothetical protein
MKVKELIEQLSKLNPELHVFVPGYEGGFNDAGPVSDVKHFALDVNEEWYYGKHEELSDPNDDKFMDHAIVEGVIL